MTGFRVYISLLVASALSGQCLWTGTASAGDTKPKAAAKKKADSSPKPDDTKPAVDTEALKKQLQSGKEADILKALQTIQDNGDPALAPLVNDFLRSGSTPKATEVALVTAGNLKDASSSEAIAPYVQHRSASIRRQAALALLKTRGPIAVATLRRALRSSDAAVRGIAATGMGNMGAKEAVSDLMQALDHGVAEAAGSIGQLCAPTECEQFAERTGRLTLDILTSGFDQILFRPSADMPDDEKIRVIGRLRELGTKEAAKFLTDVADRWPKEWTGKVKESLDLAIKTLQRGAAE